MERVDIVRDSDVFDKLVHKGFDGAPALPDDGCPTIAFKDAVTVQGNAGCVVAFRVKLPDGSIATAQTVITLNNLWGLLAAMRGWFGHGQN